MQKLTSPSTQKAYPDEYDLDNDQEDLEDPFPPEDPLAIVDSFKLLSDNKQLSEADLTHDDTIKRIKLNDNVEIDEDGFAVNSDPEADE